MVPSLAVPLPSLSLSSSVVAAEAEAVVVMPKRAARAARFSASVLAFVGGRFCVKSGAAGAAGFSSAMGSAGSAGFSSAVVLVGSVVDGCSVAAGLASAAAASPAGCAWSATASFLASSLPLLSVAGKSSSS